VALPRLVAWRRIDADGLGIAGFDRLRTGELSCDGQEVVVAGKRRWAVDFGVLLNERWETGSIYASTLAEKARELFLTS
jgi:hypothetical protein